MQKLANILRYWLAKWTGPQMIYGYTDAEGKYLKDTRISNMTDIISPQNLKIGDNVFIGHFNFIDASNGINIGEGCQITNYSSILSHSSHISIRLYGRQYRQEKDPIGYIKGSVQIGKYTFVGPHVTIMPGTRIGKGCIVSAYSMLKGEYPDHSVIKGSPAEVVGSTSDMDAPFLEKHEELRTYHKNWNES